MQAEQRRRGPLVVGGNHREAATSRQGGSASGLRAIADTLLEVTVVGSFSRIGPAVRRRLFGWTDPPRDALAGRTVLVTGPTSGLGRAAVDVLAGLGARVVLLGRSEERLLRLRDELAAGYGEDRFPVVVADMGSLGSVRAAVDRILATESRLDVVVDNAGAIYPERSDGPDGIEATVAVLVAGPFALLAGLLPLLRRTPGARVIAVTSGGMYAQALDLDDLESRRGAYSGARAYARAKRAQTALMREWARRLRADGIAWMAMHPGWTDTPGLAESLPDFYRLMRPVLRTPAEGVDTIAWLATLPDPAAASGRLFLDRRARPFDRVPGTRLTLRDRRRLWDRVVELTGGVDPVPEN
jgi:NAD(P)-dependent dehydrogenase (short-subunit alcohol dehydrogenase family)